MAASGAYKLEAEAVGVTVPDGKAVDRKLTGVEDWPARERNELERDGRPALAPQPCEHSDHHIERARTAVNAHDLGAAAQPQGGKQSGNAEDMVEMAVREQDPVEPAKARSAAEQLTLYPFAAIDENTMPACP